MSDANRIVRRSKSRWWAGGAAALVLLCLLALGRPALALIHVGALETHLGILDVEVVDGLAYLAVSRGLRIVDVRNPRAPVEIGSIALSDDREATDVEIVGKLAFVALTGDGLAVVDVSRPTEPVQIGALEERFNTVAVKVVGTLAYLIDDLPSRLRVVDVSNPRQPVEIAALDLSGQASDVDVVQGLAFVALGEDGVAVVNVSDPRAPALIATLDTPGIAFDVQFAAGAVFVADGAGGLRVISVPFGAGPREIGSLATRGTSTVRVVGDRAYLGGALDGLLVVDVSDPSRPVALGSLGAPGGGVQSVGTTLNREEVAVAVAGPLAFVAGERGLAVVDLSVEAFPAVIGQLAGGMMALGVDVAGSLAYVADGFAGLRVIDVAQTPPLALGTLATLDRAVDVEVQGGIAHVADRLGGLRLIDVSDPARPRNAGVFDTLGAAMAVDVVGPLAYLADFQNGLVIVDVSNPAAPIEVATAPQALFAMDVQVVGGLAYVAERRNDLPRGLRIFDVSNPSAPRQVGSLRVGDGLTALAVRGGLVFATGSRTLHVLDVSDPTAPRELGSFLEFAGEGFEFRDVELLGSVVAVAARAGDLDVPGVLLFDVSDPTRPREIGRFATSDAAEAVRASGSRLHVAASGAGLQILELGPEYTSDADSDGALDARDGCPRRPDPAQSDRGGVASPTNPAGDAPDGIGDACQCGDVNSDGRVTGVDATLIARSLLGLPPFPSPGALPAPDRCDVGGAAGCDSTDAVLIRRATLGLTPSLRNVCPAFVRP